MVKIVKMVDKAPRRRRSRTGKWKMVGFALHDSVRSATIPATAVGAVRKRGFTANTKNTMQSPNSNSVSRNSRAVIETLENRGYLSAVPSATVEPPTAATSVMPVRVQAAPGVAKRPSFSNRNVVTPVDLTPHVTGIVKRSQNGKVITVQVIVNNAGPVAAKGTLRITVEFSYYLNGANPIPFKVVKTPINIAAGKGKTVRITGAIPKSYQPHEYDMVVTINGDKKIPETNYANDVNNSAYYYLA